MEAGQVSAAEFDAVIIPGGYAPDLMRRYPDMVKLVREAFEGGKVVAAICHAGWMLVSSDVLKGKRATCLFAIKDDLVNAGATYLDQEVVVDGNLITSRMPDDLPAVADTLDPPLAELQADMPGIPDVGGVLPVQQSLPTMALAGLVLVALPVAGFLTVRLGRRR